MAHRGKLAQQRRRIKRARQRREMLLAAASGSTSLPLSGRDDAWDASAARNSLSDGQFADAHFWHENGRPADEITGYKLPFAQNRPPLTAIWRGVTAAAGAVSGARGGVDIPSGDVAGVKARISSYYRKAADKYDDPNLKPPWQASEGESAADLLAYAEVGSREGKEYEERLGHWRVQLGEASATEAVEILAASVLGPPVTDEELIRDLATEALGTEFQHHVICECHHRLSEHAGADGPCTHEDGRGTCSCSGYAEMALEEAEVRVQRGLTYSAVDSDYGYVCCIDCGIELASEDERVYEEDGIGFVVCQTCFDKHESGEEFAPDDSMPCDCGHNYADHPNGGACMAEECSCKGFKAAEMEQTAVEGEEQAVIAAGEEDVIAPDAPVVGCPWQATMCPEGKPTDDGRMFARGAISWRELPLTLMAQTETQPGHDGAQVAGRIDRIWRDGDLIMAQGVFDDSEFGNEIARMVDEQVLRGISVDVAVRSSEIISRAQAEGGSAETPEEDEGPSLLDILMGEDIVFVVTDGVIGATTVVPFPAFEDACISLTASGPVPVATFVALHDFKLGIEPDVQEPLTASVAQVEVLSPPEVTEGLREALSASEEVSVEVLTAAAAGLAPQRPPSSWFNDPQLDQPTPLTVTDEGRVYGHAALWETCHIGIPGMCQTAPHTNTEYAYFLLKEIECDDGARVAVGTITLDTSHANPHLSRPAAAAHYDHTGTAVADVSAGEDEHGIWFAGTLRPEADSEKVRKLRGATLSGDWRSVHGNLELVALLAVNVPGFPVPRPHAEVQLAASGAPHLTSMLATGIVEPEGEVEQETEETAAEREAFAAVLEAAREPL